MCLETYHQNCFDKTIFITKEKFQKKNFTCYFFNQPQEKNDFYKHFISFQNSAFLCRHMTIHNFKNISLYPALFTFLRNVNKTCIIFQTHNTPCCLDIIKECPTNCHLNYFGFFSCFMGTPRFFWQGVFIFPLISITLYLQK